MIAIIRIVGEVNVSGDIADALSRLRLRKKYSAVLLPETTELKKLLKKIRNHVSYGEIKTETLAKLLAARARPLEKGKKIDAKKILTEIEKKPLSELGLKPFFRLHPPRGGIDSKKHSGVGKGVLGENKKINELIERML
ncbi:MAG: uL30 family ribosomal protein [Nanoarchaeota archaeon]|nr:uL30 family ribosomal protein [Nanoarchaeota archaeon]MBU0977799.1 uL30 family ribosomal protein [Nanoarchaeota archaeon]